MVDAGKYNHLLSIWGNDFFLSGVYKHKDIWHLDLNAVSNYTWPQTKILLSLKIGRAPKRKDRLPTAIFEW